MEKDKKKQVIKLCLAVSIIAVILIIVIAIIIKYQVEGDKNMPFNLSKMVIISTAEGIESEGNSKWNFNIFQNNDIYFYIDKNDQYMGNDKQIEKVRIENIQINKPIRGEIKAYMPNSVEGRVYSYAEEYIVDNKLEYRGATKSNPQTLEVGNQGGNVSIRFSNVNLGQYTSNEDTEIVHDGTLLKKLGISQEDIKFNVSFDFVIQVSNYEYTANINLDLPYGNILEEGTSSLEKVDMSDIVFKRN